MQKETYPKKFILVENVPNDFKVKSLGHGFSGECYLTEDNQVYKELYNSLLDMFNLKQFTYIDDEYFSFPKTIVYQDSVDDDHIIGYLMNYIEGITLREIPDDEKIQDIINASNILEQHIKQISEYGVRVFDCNTLYTPNKEFKLIDTDLYPYWPQDEPYYLYRDSMKEWGNTLMCMFSGYPFKSNKLNEYYELLIHSGKMKPSYFINYALEEIQKETKEEVETLGDYKKGLKLIKK